MVKICHNKELLGAERERLLSYELVERHEGRVLGENFNFAALEHATPKSLRKVNRD